MVQNRIINKTLRRYLQNIALCCIFWMLLRLVKYEMTVRGDTINFLIHYAYYIPLIMIPTFSFFAALYTRHSEKYYIPKIIFLPIISTSLSMILFVIFTTYQQLLYKMKYTFFQIPDDVLKIGYTIITIYLILLRLTSVALIIARSKVPNKKYLALQPIAVLFFGCNLLPYQKFFSWYLEIAIKWFHDFSLSCHYRTPWRLYSNRNVSE